MELHENHQQEGGEELSEASEQADEERVQEALDDPSSLLTPTELKDGGHSGGDVGNTTGDGNMPIGGDQSEPVGSD